MELFFNFAHHLVKGSCLFVSRMNLFVNEQQIINHKIKTKIMKKTYALGLGLISGLAVVAQSGEKKVVHQVEGDYELVSGQSDNSLRAATDTLLWSEFNTTNAALWGSPSGNGYLFGVDSSHLASPQGTLEITTSALAQAYSVPSGASYVVEGAIVSFGVAHNSVSGDPNSGVDIQLLSLEGASAISGPTSTAPDTIGPKTVLTSENLLITTIGSNQGMGVVTFGTPQTVTSDFAIGVDMSNLYTNGDTVAVIADNAGDAHVSRSNYWEQTINGTSSFWSVVAGFYTVQGGAPLDNNLAIFAIVDAGSANTGSEESNFFQGIKLSQNFPNPAVGHTTITYELDKSSDVTLEIFDVTGKKVLTLNEGNRAAGSIHTVELNDELKPGTYFYSLNASGNRLTKRMIIE